MDRLWVSSSNVASVGYDAAQQTLEVEFHGGQVYQYYGVPSAIHEAMMQAPSKGRFLHQNVRNAYPYSRVG